MVIGTLKLHFVALLHSNGCRSGNLLLGTSINGIYNRLFERDTIIKADINLSILQSLEGQRTLNGNVNLLFASQISLVGILFYGNRNRCLAIGNGCHQTISIYGSYLRVRRFIHDGHRRNSTCLNLIGITSWDDNIRFADFQITADGIVQLRHHLVTTGKEQG